MKEEQHQFLRLLGQLPARLTAEQAAWRGSGRSPPPSNPSLSERCVYA
jgi:hypothetical protein